jgi:pimeloyl-ACP methyl ester carboxylesterase
VIDNMSILGLLIWVPLLFLGVTLLHADDFSSGGVKIHYVVKGEGESVVLIHGLYSSAKGNWQGPGIMTELARHYRVVAFDLRAHGQSDRPEGEDQYGVQMAEDVVRLMDHLQIPRAHLVGYSLGGIITLKLLTLHPQRVSSAVLGGMGWLKTDCPFQRVWEIIRDFGNPNLPAACLNSIAKLGVTEAEVKAVRVPVTIIIGDRDPCRWMYVEPLRRVRPEWPERVIADANHVNCIAKREFKAQILATLAQSLPNLAKQNRSYSL